MFSVRLAGLVVRIDNQYDYVRRHCRDYIVEDSLEADITASATHEEILQELGLQGETELSQMEESKRLAILAYGEGLCIYRHISREMVRFGGFLIHAAVVAVDGEAYAFTAKSGTGKTTHMRLWLDRFGERAEVVNGDKPILRWIDDTLYAYGTPWCGSEEMGNNMRAPLRALCFVERSETNSITRIPPSDVIGRIFQQLLIPQDEETLDRFLALVEKMIAETDCFLLRCNMQPEAAQVAWQGIQGVRE